MRFCSSVHRYLFGQLASLFILSTLVGACGKTRYVTEHVQEFRVYTAVADQDMREAVSFLIDSFNDEVGIEAIISVDRLEDSNSTISFKKGLRDDGEKLGYGQWKTWTTLDEDGFVLSQRTVTKTINYSMDLVFDFTNFQSKIANPDRTSGDWSHVYHLFCHEVGHGLQMTHDADINSVMYETIPEASRPSVDYVEFFKQARSFFEKSARDNQKS